VILYLLGRDDPLAAALRDQVNDVFVFEPASPPCCASRHIWADVQGAGRELTDGYYHVAEAHQHASPETRIRLSITVSGHLTHLEITHQDEVGPMELPDPSELADPVWWEHDPSPAPPWEWKRWRRETRLAS
jgi:hypothetical protein